MLKKQKYNLLFLDDQPSTLTIFLKTISKIPFIGEVVVVSDPIECLNILDEKEIDILLLDMDLGTHDMDGNTLFGLIKDPPVTVACSNFSPYVYSSREMGIKTFIGKFSSYRVIEESLYDSVLEVDRRIDKRKRNVQELELRNVAGEDVIVKVEDIYYALINNNILTIYLKDKIIVTQMSLKSFANKLPFELFAKSHNSYLVALGKIHFLKGKHVYLTGKWEENVLPISQEFSNEFKHKYELYRQYNMQ